MAETVFRSARRLIPLLPFALLTPLSGCLAALLFDSNKVPDKAHPTLTADTFLEVDSHTEVETHDVKVGGGKTCITGSSDCIETTDYKKKNFDVHVASAKVDGRQIPLHELASAASDDYVRETERAHSAHRSCRIGGASQLLGYTAALAGLVMLQQGFDEDNPNRNLAIGGYAAVGAGVVGVLGGMFVFGGQRCGESEKLYNKWETVYVNADKTEVRGEAADILVEFAKKFKQKDDTGTADSSSTDDTTEGTEP